MFSSFPREPGTAGSKTDFKFVFIGPLEVGQDGLIPADVKRHRVTVEKLEAYLNSDTPTGQSILVSMYKNGVSIGQVEIAVGETYGELELAAGVTFEEGDIGTATIDQTGNGVRGGTLTFYGRIG